MLLRDSYFRSETAIMEWFYDFKGRLLRPFLQFLTSLHVHPHGVSFVSGLVATIAIMLAIAWESKEIFVWGIWAHLLLDGLDGPLARYQKRHGPQGSLVDNLADHVGLLAICLYALHFSAAHTFAVLFVAVFYTLLRTLDFVLRFGFRRSTYMIRPRTTLLLVLTIDILFEWDLLWPVMTIIAALLFPLLAIILVQTAQVMKPEPPI